MPTRSRARRAPAPATGLAGALAAEAGELVTLARRAVPTRRVAMLLGLALLALLALNGVAGASEPEPGDRTALEAFGGASPAPAASAGAAASAWAAASVAAVASSAPLTPDALPPDALAASPMFAGPDVLDLALKGGLVIALLFVTLRVLRRVQGTSTGAGAGRQLDVVESRTIGPKMQLHLVAVGDRRLVVGQSPSGFVALGELDAAELPVDAQGVAESLVLAELDEMPPTPWDRSAVAHEDVPVRRPTTGTATTRVSRSADPGPVARSAADLAAEARRHRERPLGAARRADGLTPADRAAADGDRPRLDRPSAIEERGGRRPDRAADAEHTATGSRDREPSRRPAAARPVDVRVAAYTDRGDARDADDIADRPLPLRTSAARPVGPTIEERVELAASRARADRLATAEQGRRVAADRAERRARVERALEAADRAAGIAERAALAAERALEAARSAESLPGAGAPALSAADRATAAAAIRAAAELRAPSEDPRRTGRRAAPTGSATTTASRQDAAAIAAGRRSTASTDSAGPATGIGSRIAARLLGLPAPIPAAARDRRPEPARQAPTTALPIDRAAAPVARAAAPIARPAFATHLDEAPIEAPDSLVELARRLVDQAALNRAADARTPIADLDPDPDDRALDPRGLASLSRPAARAPFAPAVPAAARPNVDAPLPPASGPAPSSAPAPARASDATATTPDAPRPRRLEMSA